MPKEVYAMTDLAIQVGKIPFDYKDCHAYMDKVEKLIDSYANDGIVGNVVQTHVADGYAVYEVCWAKGSKAYLRHVDYLDGYRDMTIERMGKIFRDPMNDDGYIIEVPLRFVKSHLDSERALRAIFEKAS